mmetsp:Transcript_19512/g.39503  ORF Transcript_19512/g.39503 Transcript_19512/m.39503 type:complete len:347 (-) Transcript_19512:142-1182(-)|eukprot:CAMPEP_0183308502 /NCGR_PEP_ID=MMETSP0160_2-20130417/22294_1 /TAXON_ID=2839 ORGANISM="Odontella Sinensis, Strain Grunow 1884" /NCGR_SAMPLE_ID=MMETSP0160_2 /ASSEMBLY_ACC=CAM_ASM_000250 /LENGTH=346 /DNA_ID=CAMNT_0025472355 /DNA_START=191 /DNA_END=1231 /DNA_ORIENTATION=+
MGITDHSTEGADSGGHDFAPAAWDMMRDQLEIMIQQEDTKYRVHAMRQRNGQLQPFSFVDGGDLDVCRRKMCEWAFNVVDYFDFSRDLVSVSLNHADRFMASILASGGSICKRRFQSISVTALYLTLKLQGMSSGRVDAESGRKRLLSIRTFVELSRGILSIESLEVEEEKMMKGLGYLLNPPTPVKFVEYLVHFLAQGKNSSSISRHALPTSKVDDRTLHYTYELARYFTELAVFERALSTGLKPSCIAYASILNAMDAMDARALSASTKDDFKRCVSSLTSLQVHKEDITQAQSLLSKLCPLEALEWPGNEIEDVVDETVKKGSSAPIRDDFVRDSPSSVRNFP